MPEEQDSKPGEFEETKGGKTGKKKKKKGEIPRMMRRL